MSFRARGILIVVALFVAFFPVKLETECTYSFDTGNCTEAGRSLIGLPIPSLILSGAAGLVFLVLMLARFAYIGYGMDRAERRRSPL